MHQSHSGIDLETSPIRTNYRLDQNVYCFSKKFMNIERHLQIDIELKARLKVVERHLRSLISHNSQVLPFEKLAYFDSPPSFNSKVNQNTQLPLASDSFCEDVCSSFHISFWKGYFGIFKSSKYTVYLWIFVLHIMDMLNYSAIFVDVFLILVKTHQKCQPYHFSYSLHILASSHNWTGKASELSITWFKIFLMQLCSTSSLITYMCSKAPHFLGNAYMNGTSHTSLSKLGNHGYLEVRTGRIV